MINRQKKQYFGEVQMNSLNLKIQNVKNIKNCNFEVPLSGGIYALVGENGCGKSTILAVLSRVITWYKFSNILKPLDYSENSVIEFTTENVHEVWENYKGKWNFTTSQPENKFLRVKGMYEGSLFYGTRFNDPSLLDQLLREKKISDELIVDADEYVKQNLSYILHGDYLHYKNLKKLNMGIKQASKKFGLKNQPHFLELPNGRISQYRMSSGECLLISLLYFIYNSFIKNVNGLPNQILMLIDEIEVALHPKAVDRFLDLLENLSKEHKGLTVILTTHSPEVIRRINHKNLYQIDNINGDVQIIYGVYANYVIHDIYKFVGSDFLILVEDDLAKDLVEGVLQKNKLNLGKTVNVMPVGGFDTVLKMQEELIKSKLVGDKTKLFSILDGDIKDQVRETKLPHLFLPIPSVEKFLHEQIITKKNMDFIRRLNDRYFRIGSVGEIVADYNKKYKTADDKNGKKLYNFLLQEMNPKISEDKFISYLSEDIMDIVDLTGFVHKLKGMLQ